MSFFFAELDERENEFEVKLKPPHSFNSINHFITQKIGWFFLYHSFIIYLYNL